MKKFFQMGYQYYTLYSKATDPVPKPKHKTSEQRIAWMSGWIQARTDDRLKGQRRDIRK